MFGVDVRPTVGQTRTSPYTLTLIRESDAGATPPHAVRRTYAEFDALRTSLLADVQYGDWVKALEFPTDRTGVFGGFDDPLVISRTPLRG